MNILHWKLQPLYCYLRVCFICHCLQRLTISLFSLWPSSKLLNFRRWMISGLTFGVPWLLPLALLTGIWFITVRSIEGFHGFGVLLAKTNANFSFGYCLMTESAPDNSWEEKTCIWMTITAFYAPMLLRRASFVSSFIALLRWPAGTVSTSCCPILWRLRLYWKPTRFS